jgi:hypothetical protein
MRDHLPTNNTAPTSILNHADVFEAIEAEGASLAADSNLQLDVGPCTPGVPSKAITIGDARRLVNDPAVPDPVRDEIWASLVRRAQAAPRRWEQIAIWMMLPRLRGITGRLRRIWRNDVQDIRSEVLVGFIEAVRQADPIQPGIGARLWWNAYRLARQACWHATREWPTDEIDRFAARQAATDHATAAPAGPVPVEMIADGSHDRNAVEGERLGSLASRLGLRTVIDGHLPPATNTRGNGSGEAA